MIVTLDQLLFREDAAQRLLGFRLVLAANERCHVLLTDPLWEADVADQPINRWLSGLPPDLMDAVQKTLEEGVDEASNMSASVAGILVKPTSTSRWEEGVLSPDDALRLMQTPLWLVLENGRNDLQFLRRILERKDRDTLDKHLDEGRVEVPLGGGTGEVKLFLENLATLPSTPTLSRETTSWIRRLRSWAMFDRDAQANDPRLPSRTSESLRELCAGMARPWPFPGNQLGRRTIENYLPFEALDRWANGGDDSAQRRQRVEAFKSSNFGGRRRACFAMKEGFVKDVAQSVREEFKHRDHPGHKLKIRWVQADKLPAAFKSKPRRRGRRLEDSELPTVFQGLQNTAFRVCLTRGFGTKIAELYADTDVDDIWFHRVFAEDPAARVWREGLIESLWGVL